MPAGTARHLRSATRPRRIMAWSLPTVISLFIAFVGSSASATTGSYSDPRPCSASVQSGICISQVSAQYGATTITLSMTVGKATDPTTDTNWLQGSAEVGWGIWLNSATSPSYISVDLEVVGQFLGSVATNAPTITCLGSSQGVSASFDLNANTYSVAFPPSCIGSPSSIAVEAVYLYGTQSYKSPVAGSCCTASADQGSTTTTTTSTTTTTTPTSTTTTTTPSTSTTTTSTTVPISDVAATATTTTTTTTSPASTTSSTQAVVTSSASTSGGSGPLTASSSSGQLAFTGTGKGLPILVAVGTVLFAVGTSVRRRLARISKGRTEVLN